MTCPYALVLFFSFESYYVYPGCYHIVMQNQMYVTVLYLWLGGISKLVPFEVVFNRCSFATQLSATVLKTNTSSLTPVILRSPTLTDTIAKQPILGPFEDYISPFSEASMYIDCFTPWTPLCLCQPSHILLKALYCVRVHFVVLSPRPDSAQNPYKA